MEKDIADYAKDGRLTELSDGKRYECASNSIVQIRSAA